MKRQSISLVNQWKQRVDDFDSANARTRDMTKLFYIHHHKVNEIIKDPIKSSDQNRISQVTNQIDKVLKGTQNLKDPFIKSLTRDNNINNFKQSFNELIGMLKTTTRLNEQKGVVNNLLKKRAFSATLLKDDKRQNNIHEEIKSSTRRMNSVKAGKALRIIIDDSIERRGRSSTAGVGRRAIRKERGMDRDVEDEFREKKGELQSMISTFIVKKSVTDFKIIGKNERLHQYFDKRKELTDLYLGSKSLTPCDTPKRSIVFSEDDEMSEPHFMTELGVDVNKIKKPLVKRNVERVIEIVNEKLIEQRKGRELEKYQKMKEIQFNRLAELQQEAFNHGKKQQQKRQREKERQKERQKERELRLFEETEQYTERDNKILMMSTFKTSASIGKKLYIENTPQMSSRTIDAQRKMARKFSSRMF